MGHGDTELTNTFTRNYNLLIFHDVSNNIVFITFTRNYDYAVRNIVERLGVNSVSGVNRWKNKVSDDR